MSASFIILRWTVFLQTLVASATPPTCCPLVRDPALQLTVAAASQQGDRVAARRLRSGLLEDRLARMRRTTLLQMELLIATSSRNLLVSHGPSRPVATSDGARHRRTSQLRRGAAVPSRSALQATSADVSPFIRAEGPRMGGVSETSHR